jgi:hypothetical protein
VGCILESVPEFKKDNEYLKYSLNEPFNMMLCTKYSLAMGGHAWALDKTLV